MSQEWTIRQALFCLIGSTCFTLAVSLTGYFAWKEHQKGRLESALYRILAIVQTGPEKEALKTAYLAELLGLSADAPMPLYALNLKKAEKDLLASPLIASAKVKRLPPSTLYIDYTVRKPIAWMADFKNIGVDREGYLFPIDPFLSPKKLPGIYLGLHAESGWKVEGPHFDLALGILQFLETAPWKEGLQILRIDVSNAFAPSLGQREIVLFTEEELSIRKENQEIVCVFPKILRLAPKEYTQQLNNFFALRRAMMDDYKRQIASVQQGGRFAPRIIDLRIPQLAFVEKG
ncbi:MAG: FtsQ-type POTRA domain-containing protein [Chlamydiales bacterium]